MTASNIQSNLLIKTLLTLLVSLLFVVSHNAVAGATLTDDTYVSNKTPTKNFGSQPAIILNSAKGYNQVGLLKFKLDGSLPNNAEPSKIAKATLKLFVTKLALPKGENAGNVALVLNKAASIQWNETTVNGSTDPGIGDMALQQEFALSESDLNRWIEFDVTDILHTLSAQEPLLVAFRLGVSVGSGATVVFDSKENKSSGKIAELELVYGGAGETGAVGPQGAQGPKGDTGATGAQGVQGLKGDTGAQGVQGAKGDKGETGPQGPSGVVSTSVFNGYPGDISGGSNAWVFVGPTATVTTTANQRLIASGFAALGLDSGSPMQISIDVCYQSTGAATNVVNMNGGAFAAISVTTTRMAIPALGSAVPGVGSWKVGYCVKNATAFTVNNNDYVNGWVMVTN